MRGGFRVERFELRFRGVDALRGCLDNSADILVLERRFCVLPCLCADLVKLRRNRFVKNALRVLDALLRRCDLALRTFEVRLCRFERLRSAIPHGEVFFGDIVQERRFRVRLQPRLFRDGDLRVREDDARVHKVGFRFRQVRRFRAVENRIERAIGNVDGEVLRRHAVNRRRP